MLRRFCLCFVQRVGKDGEDVLVSRGSRLYRTTWNPTTSHWLRHLISHRTDNLGCWQHSALWTLVMHAKQWRWGFSELTGALAEWVPKGKSVGKQESDIKQPDTQATELKHWRQKCLSCTAHCNCKTFVPYHRTEERWPPHGRHRQSSSHRNNSVLSTATTNA